MNIETKWNVGDEVYYFPNKKSIIAMTIEEIVVRIEHDKAGESKISVTYYGKIKGDTQFHESMSEQNLVSREEAIKAFDHMRSEEFMKLFG